MEEIIVQSVPDPDEVGMWSLEFIFKVGNFTLAYCIHEPYLFSKDEWLDFTNAKSTKMNFDSDGGIHYSPDGMWKFNS